MSNARRAGLPAALVTAALLLSACGSLDVTAGSARPASAASIEVTPAPTGAPVAPAEPLVVSAEHGRLTTVSVTGPDGPLTGTLSSDGRTFTVPSGRLDYAATYVVTAEAVDRAGFPTRATSTLRTVAPSKFLGFTMSPRQDAVVGVGMPIRLQLDSALGKQTYRAAFERLLSVTADGIPVDGAWSWQSSRVLEYRPRDYWPAHATIAVTAHLKGERITTSLWGQKDRTVSFQTGAAMISYVDISTLEMTVTEDGKVIRTIPVTTGKEGFETRNGIKVISTKETTRLMDAATGGTDPTDPEYYSIEVQYAMRLTNSGEFLHAAPWSVAQQGRESVSHGCTGMSTENALWLFERSHLGDVVVYTGGIRALEPGNGITVWNESFDQWRKGSAL